MDFLESKSTPLVIAVFCLLGSAASFYAFYQDFRSQGDRGLGLPIGRIDYFETQVRRKTGNSFIWNDVEKSINVYKKDSIKTGPKSTATITLDGNASIEIGENSLVVLENTKDLASNFRAGNFTIRSQKEQKQVQVKEGKPVTTVLPISLVAPKPFAQIEGFKQEPIAFEWNTEEFTDNVVLELSTKRSFVEKASVQFPISLKKDRHTLPYLETGTYYWRLSKDGKALSNTSSFTVRTLSLPVLLSPANISIPVDTKKASKISFAWSETPWSANLKSRIKMELEISSSTEFQSPLKNISVSAYQTSASLDGLSPGTYYWRLTLHDASKVFHTPTSFFNLIDSAMGVALTLSAPAAAAQILFWEEAPEFKFEWNSHPLVENDKDTTYELLVSNEKTFKSPVVFLTRENSFASEKLELREGDYFWKVRIKKDKKDLLSTTERHFFYGHYPLLRAPASLSKVEMEVFDLAKTEKSYTARWDAVEHAKHYQFTLKSHGKVILSKSVEKTQFDLPNLKVGEFSWHVSAVDVLDRTGVSSKEHGLKVIRTRLQAPKAVQSEVE